MTGSLTPAGTPQSIHTIPSWVQNPTSPADPAQFQAWASALLEGFEQQVALALLNVSILGVEPFQALQQFGQDPGAVISTLISAFGGVGSGLSALTTSVEDAIADLLSGADWQNFLNGFANTLGHTGGEPYSAADVLIFLAEIPGTLISGALNTAVTISGNALSALFNGSGLIASEIAGALNTAVTISGNALSTLFNGSGTLASALTGAVNTAITISGNAISTLFNGSGLIASQIAGALNTAVTIGGTAVSTLFQYLDSAGQFAAAHLTGALNTAITISGNALTALFNGSGALASALTGAINTGVTVAGNAISSLFNGSGLIASQIAGALNTAVTISGNAISSLFNGSGLIASQIAGALNTAVTIGGTAISTLFQYLDSLGQFSAAHITGALNTAITVSGNAISALFNGSGLIASQIAGALNTAITISGNAISALFNSSGVLASIVNGALNTAVTISGNALSALFNSSGVLASAVNGALNTAVTISGNAISSLFNGSGVLASIVNGALNTAVTISGNAVSTLFNGSGLIASQIAGALNTAVTISGNAISTLFNASGVLGSAINGAINTAATISGKALSTLFNSSGLIASQIAGALNTAVTISGNAISSLFGAGGVLATAIVNVLGGSSLGADLQAIATTLFGSSTTASQVQQAAIPPITSGGNTNLFQDIQNGWDAIVNALTGGSGAGNTPTVVASTMGAIPHTNVVIPPNSGTGSITVDVASTALTSATGTATTLSTSGSVTVGSTANYLVIEIAFNTASGSVGIDVEYGGQPMSLLSGGGASGLSGDSLTIGIYGLLNPPTGAHTALVSLSANDGQKIWQLQAQATSLIGVASVDSVKAPAHVSGSNGSMSQTFTSVTGDYVLNTMAVIAGSSETLSSYSQTSRYNPGSTNNASAPGGKFLAMLAGDASGAASVTLSATASFTTTNKWASTAVNLIPLAAAAIGSGIEYKRASATAVTPSTSTTTTFANSFFDTQVNKSSDITYSTTGNTVTVGYDGWYDFAMAVSSGNTTIAGNQRMTCVLFKNGSAYKAGADGFGTSSGVGAAIISHMACTLYLKATETVQPGYRSTSSANQFKENNSGVDTWFSLSLSNRSLA